MPNWSVSFIPTWFEVWLDAPYVYAMMGLLNWEGANEPRFSLGKGKLSISVDSSRDEGFVGVIRETDGTITDCP